MQCGVVKHELPKGVLELRVTGDNAYVALYVHAKSIA